MTTVYTVAVLNLIWGNLMKTMVNHPRKKMHIHTYKPSLHCQGVQQTSHHPFAKLMLVKNLICTTLQLTKHLHIHYLRGNDSVGKARVDYETHYAGKKKWSPERLSHLLKVTEPMNSGASMWVQVCQMPDSRGSAVHLYCFCVTRNAQTSKFTSWQVDRGAVSIGRVNVKYLMSV